MVRTKYKYVVLLSGIIILCKYFGAFTHMFEKDFYVDFHYPYDGDIRNSVEQLRHNEEPDVKPINVYNYSFILNAKDKCKSGTEDLQPRLVYVVKSALDHFDRRIAIRNSWGYEKRFSDVLIRIVFLLGAQNNQHLMGKIQRESEKFGDIVQANFIDNYYNNTIKSMMGFKWAMTFCPNSKFYMFVDDDMYVSTKNVLRFIRNPTNYPNYLKEPIYSLKNKVINKRDATDLHQPIFISRKVSNSNVLINQNLSASNSDKIVKSKRIDNSKKYKRGIEQITSINPHIIPNDTINSNATNKLQTPRDYKRQIMDFELADDVKLYAGYVFLSAPPHRHMSSKWHVSLEEYPYHMWPPYVTAGSYILSREALHEMYYTSFYTKNFRFDDIYLGLLALKANIEPYHCAEFHFYKKPYSIGEYTYVISSHGYDDVDELLKVWNEQRSSGNA